MGSHFFLQGIFLTQGSNVGLLQCRQILYCLSHQGSPCNSPLEWNATSELRLQLICYIQFKHDAVIWIRLFTTSRQFPVVVQSLSCVWFFVIPCCGTSGLPVLCYIPEFAQNHVHWVGDAIQPSHPLPSPSLFIFNLSQHQGLFQWVECLHQVAKVLELQLQDQNQSFQWIFRVGHNQKVSFCKNNLAVSLDFYLDVHCSERL